jgi:CRISPR-associated protein Cmr5
MNIQKMTEQRRAQAAWEAVEAVRGGKKDYAEEYGSTVKKLPMMILTNGLGQALAFLKAKAKGKEDDEHEAVFRHLSGWVGKELKLEGDLLSAVVSGDSNAYRRATAESLAFLTWLKKFVEAANLGKEDAGAPGR